MRAVTAKVAFLWALSVRGLTAGAVMLVLLEFAAWATGWMPLSMTSVVIYGSFSGILLHGVVVGPIIVLASWPTRARCRRYREQEVLTIDPEHFHVLVSLLGGEKHGYGIAKEIAERTDDEVWLYYLVYGRIRRLQEEGLVAEPKTLPAPDLGGAPRRHFRLTPQGRALAEREIDRACAEGLIEVPYCSSR